MTRYANLPLLSLGGFYKSPDPVTLLSCKTACLTLRTVTPV